MEALATNHGEGKDPRGPASPGTTVDNGTNAHPEHSGNDTLSGRTTWGDPFPTTVRIIVPESSEKLSLKGEFYSPRADRVRPLISTLFVQHRSALVGFTTKDGEINYGLRNILTYLENGNLVTGIKDLRGINEMLKSRPKAQMLLVSIVNASHAYSRDARPFVNYCVDMYGKHIFDIAKQIVSDTKGCPVGRAGFRHILTALKNPKSVDFTIDDWKALFIHVFLFDDVPSLFMLFRDTVTLNFSITEQGDDIAILPSPGISLDYSSEGEMAQFQDRRITQYVARLVLLYYTGIDYDVTRNESPTGGDGVPITYWLTPANAETSMVVALNMSSGMQGETFSAQLTARGATAKTFWRNARSVFDWVAMLVDGITPKNVNYGPRALPNMRDGHPMRFMTEVSLNGVPERNVNLVNDFITDANHIAVAAVICQQSRWSESFMTLARYTVTEMYSNWRMSWIEAAASSMKGFIPAEELRLLSPMERASMMFSDISMKTTHLGDHVPLLASAALFLLQTLGLDDLATLSSIPLILWDADDHVGIEVFGLLKEHGARVSLEYK